MVTLTQWAVGSMVLRCGAWSVSGAHHMPFEWSLFAVSMVSAFLCTVALFMLKFTSYLASHSWPTDSWPNDSRLLLRSRETCAFLACSFRVGKFIFAVLHDWIVSSFGIRTMRGGLLSLVMLHGAFLVTKRHVHRLSMIAVFDWAVM
jgi:hypothetical protein